MPIFPAEARIKAFEAGGGIFLLGQSLAICIIIAGRFLAQHKRYLFVFVVACCQCVFMPFGTVLGVFTIVLLSRESVKSAFGASEVMPPPPGNGSG
jgi:hypothetical protein